MRSVKVPLAALLSTTILFGASVALAAEWRLTEVTGRVRVATPGQTPAAAAPNQAVPVGADITTAAGGRAVLTNGAQRMVIGPNSRMTVANGEGAGMTRIMQDLGSILFQVDKQARPHFRVDTPLLAAVVKGTTFTVAIGATSDTVHVAEGLVEVRANGGGGPQDIPAGVTGRVMRDGPAQVGVITPSATPAPAEAVQALPPLDYSQVSDGVVAGPGAPAGLDTARNIAAPQGQAALSAATDIASLGGGDGGGSSMAAARATAAAIGQGPAQIAANGAAPPAFAGPSQGGGASNPNGSESATPGNGAGNGPGANNGVGAGNGNGGAAGGPNGPEGANPGGGNGNGNGPGANNGVGNGGPAGNPNGPEGPSPGAGNGNGNGNGNGPGANNGVGNGNGNGGASGGPNGPEGANPGNGNGNGPGANNAGGNGNGNGNGGAAAPPAPETAPGAGNGNGPGANNGVGNGAASGGDSPGVGKGGKGKAD